MKVYVSHFLIGGLLTLFSGMGWSQRPAYHNAPDIYNDLEKLNFLGTVLYVAAHPDDENTRLISYFSNHVDARTGYLSLTRGDGGQNLIGTDIREKLGVIRTQELLAARRTDGGEQFFSRANDFGYSKTPDETLTIWNKEDVLQDMVKVIREFKPDIVINRFDHRTPGRTHGHHTSSALLSLDAMDLAASPDYSIEGFSDNPWQIRRMFFNTGWWFYGSVENFEKADKSNMIAIDAGVYYPLAGKSNGEIAADSRTMHKSQGFGSTGSRGSSNEYIEFIKGDFNEGSEDVFEGINTSWSRVPGGAEIGARIEYVLANFNFKDPSVHVAELVSIRKMIQGLEDGHWKRVKLDEISEIIVRAAGLYVEAVTNEVYVNAGNPLTVSVEVTCQSSVPTVLKDIEFHGLSITEAPGDSSLTSNMRNMFRVEASVPLEMESRNPYWLNEPWENGMYSVSDVDLRGKPVASPQFSSDIHVNIYGEEFVLSREVLHKRNDPVQGAIYEPLYLVPEVSVSFEDPVYIFPDREYKEVTVIVKSYSDAGIAGQVFVDHPRTWIVSPRAYPVVLSSEGDEARFTFQVKGPLLPESVELGLSVMDTTGQLYSPSIVNLEYDHIPRQLIQYSNRAKFERISLKKEGERIAYVEGAGDNIPASLRQIGYSVDILDASDISEEILSQYDALVFGIRAFNTNSSLFMRKDEMMRYMIAGGTVIVQYNTSRGLSGDEFAPYTMRLSRDRVTDENAPVTFEVPDHEVLNYPNQILPGDFDGWVQERGLYFPNEWDFRFEAPLSCADPDEPPRSGGLLVARVGQGYFIYTGFSWFRQLPAGVPGAYKLFTNMISLGKNEIPTDGDGESND
jgi:LmbE family N-acetylglucosaminyl deacetylase